MTISDELEAKILRYFYVEKWRIGTIARQLYVHHNVVRRVLRQANIPMSALIPRKSMIDPFLPFIIEALSKYPTLTASRLYNMVRERGYPGVENHFRDLISLHRPRPLTEAYLRLRTLPGEQAQVDWGHFGHILIGKEKRPLMAFVMVLSFSRKIFLQFHLNARMANFLSGHEAAFNAFQGVPKVLLYDNLKSAVLERQGDAIRFHPTLLAFSAYYRFEARPVAVARGNEKGRVERAIRYVRDNFFSARTWTNLEDLNNQAIAWSEGIAADRPCPGDPSVSVRQVFDQEKEKLYKLPDNPYPCEERVEVKVGKTPYVRFDLNDYSIPHTHIRRTLTVIATSEIITIVDGNTVLAQHTRCYDRGQQIEQEKHIKELTQEKHKARQHRGQDRLAQSSPSSVEFLIHSAEKGYHLRSTIHNLLQLLDSYGAAELEAAIIEALSKNVPHTNAVQISLEKRREQREQSPPITFNFSNNNRVNELVIRPHSLQNYDQLCTTLEENNDE